MSLSTIIVSMAHWDDRDVSQARMMNLLRTRFIEIPGVEVFVTEMPMVGGQRGEPLQFVLLGLDLTRVAGLAQELKARLEEVPGLGQLDLDLRLELPQLEMEPGRERLRNLGLTTRDVALAVNVLSGGYDVARYNDDPGNGERYDVRLKAGEGSLRQVSDLSKIDVSREILPAGYTVRMIGRAEEFGKTVNYMLFAFVTAMILVYMVLASQFNSFVQPLIIMVAQPLAIIGGVGALWLTGHSLNIYSMIWSCWWVWWQRTLSCWST